MARDRRSFLAGAFAAGGALILAGCDKVAHSPGVNAVLSSVDGLNRRLQQLFWHPPAMAQEFHEKDISRYFKPNGSIDPQDPAYKAHVAQNFADWRLVIDGLVEHPLSLSMDQLRAMPARTQITRHDCVEGWSSIGKWTGVQLARLLSQAKLKPTAKYVVFHCGDDIDKNPDGSPVFYYESLGLNDAVHPQTILAYAMNGKALGIPHGAPLRLRVENQLGYKQAKYVMRIQAVDDLKPFGQGGGGYWEDNGYEWYAGI
jgi:DMSO/TMAO reductase YedYZ molybdopterin-dependent catalytic subunit